MAEKNAIEVVTRYRVLSEEFSQREDAELYLQSLADAQVANAMWVKGATLGEVAQRFPLVFDRDKGRYVRDGIGDIHGLDFLTMKHLFKIEHWQCSRRHIYRPCRFDVHPRRLGWRVHVHGGASTLHPRSYGELLTIAQMARYAVKLVETDSVDEQVFARGGAQ